MRYILILALAAMAGYWVWLSDLQVHVSTTLEVDYGRTPILEAQLKVQEEAARAISDLLKEQPDINNSF